MSPHVKMTLNALRFSDCKDSSLAVETHLRLPPQIPVARTDFSRQGRMEKPVLVAPAGWRARAREAGVLPGATVPRQAKPL